MIPLTPELAFGVDDEAETLVEAVQESKGEAVEEDDYVQGVTEAVEPLVYPASVQAGPLFQLTIKTPANSSLFYLPTCSTLGFVHNGRSYDWSIDWGDGGTQHASGVSSDNDGIPHLYATAGSYVISITPYSSTEAWLAAFGFFYEETTTGANSLANRAMVTGILSPLTPEMTRTSDQIEGTLPAPDNEWAYTFSMCDSLVQIPVFQGWENVDSVGDYFAFCMFKDCKGISVLPDGFNLPVNITKVGNSFVSGMFQGCYNLAKLPEGFNLPQGITEVGDYFVYSFFLMCTSLTELPDGFNIPQNIILPGNGFADGMFYGCSRLAKLPNGFNLPQNITEAGDGFAIQMFAYCTDLSELPDGFNLPQGIVKTGSYFAADMFTHNMNLNSLPTGFNLPQGIISVGRDFAFRMFYSAGSPSFQISNEFTLPSGIPANSVDSFYQTFLLYTHAPVQNRSAASIIGDCPTPDNSRYTFDTRFKDIDYIAINWGGEGLEYPGAGEPGSGDLWGIGVVTIDVALVIARVVTGGGMDLTPAQFAAVDMDFDGYITMADVILIMRKASGY
jgi:hypothetical protein